MVNKSLPIFSYREEILQAVEKHHVVVVTAETGAGKSTQVPQYLQEAGYNVVVTQPRRLAARSVAERVAEEMGVEFGSLVGYRTGYERQDSPETQVLFCTDGLQLVREITGYGKAQVLVIDEVHEWNINIETLVAWARKRLSEEAPFKVVLMSATLEASKLAAYFAEVTGECPVIEVPGRLFPVEKSEKSSYELAGTVKSLIEKGRNVLVFQPGKREIADTVSELEGTSAVVLPLHGELSPSEQRRVFQHYGQPKVVVSTNVAQTSVTIDDIDAVVDSGLERRVELVDGVEGLYLKPISQADCEQRAGRAGRTKEGVYILCSDTSLSYRPEFPVAEIMRSRLDQVVLRLAVAGIDASELTFFHQPDRATITESKRTCIALGFMTQEGEVTKLGRKAAKLPVGVKVARMVLEGAERGCIDDVLTIAAIMEIGSLKARSGEWTRITDESESDALAELDIYERARQMERDGERSYFNEAGIFAKNYFRAKDLRHKLAGALRGLVDFRNGGNREDVLRSVVAGMVDHLYQYSYWGRHGHYYKNGDGDRQLARESVVKGESPWIVGMPFDLQVKTRRGGTITLNLVQWVSKVNPTWLVEVAPQLSAKERRNYRYDGSQGLVVCDLVTKFNGQEIKTDVVEGNGEDAVQALASALTNGSVEHPCVEHNREVREEVENLNRRCATKLGTIESGDLTTWYELHLDTVHTLAEALELDLNLTDADVSDLLGVEDYANERSRIKEERPDTWLIAGENHTLTYEWGWYVKGVKTALPIAVVAGLAEENLPSWEGMQMRVSVSDEDYTDLYITLPEQKLNTLREKIEARRQELAWKAFKAEGHGDYDRKEEVAYQNPLPVLPESEVWDAETDAHAHASWVYYTYSSGDDANSTWYLLWFQTEEQAQQARKKAEAKKHELDAAEYERRHFEELKAEAQALWEQVEAQLEQIDWDCYQAYGLTSNEASSSSWYDESLPNRLSKAKKLAYGDGWSNPKPTEANEALNQLQERISQALAYHTENETRRPAAEEALEAARTVYEQVYEAYSETDAVTYDERREVERAKDNAESAFESGDYIKATEEAEKATELAAPLLAKAQTQLATKKNLQDLLATEYATCPVCGDEIDPDSNHYYCDQVALSAKGQYEDFEVKVSSVDGTEVVKLVAVFDSRYNEYELQVQVVDGSAVADLNAVETKTYWKQPSEGEQKLSAEIAEVQRQIDAIQSERDHGGRVEGTFRAIEHRGNTQLQFEATFTGSVENRKAYDGSGWSSYEDQSSKFVCREHCGWLDEEPQAGQTWVCTPAFQIAWAGKPVIVVNPQVRTDEEVELKKRLVALKARLKGEQQFEESLIDADEVVDDEGMPQTAMAAALMEAMKKKGN